MKLKIFQIDAFTQHRFSGNPAAVCPLENWLTDDTLSGIAAENNLSETVFMVSEKDGYSLRWFTPVTEVDLCGHATLAAAWVLFNEYGIPEPITFSTNSGKLTVTRKDQRIIMDFPANPIAVCPEPVGLLSALSLKNQPVYSSEDFVVVVNNEGIVRDLNPDFQALQKIPMRGVCVTAPGEKSDFVCRWFGPGVGVNEDPVTGSAHTYLAPFWSGILGRDSLHSRQISARGGVLECKVKKDRVLISGHAVKYMEGTIFT